MHMNEYYKTDDKREVKYMGMWRLGSKGDYDSWEEQNWNIYSNENHILAFLESLSLRDKQSYKYTHKHIDKSKEAVFPAQVEYISDNISLLF